MFDGDSYRRRENSYTPSTGPDRPPAARSLAGLVVSGRSKWLEHLLD